VSVYINRIALLGRVTSQPKESGKAVTFTVVTNAYRKDSPESKATQFSEFHFITCYHPLNGYALKSVNKGDMLLLDGRLHYYTSPGASFPRASIIPDSLQIAIPKSEKAKENKEVEDSKPDIPF